MRPGAGATVCAAFAAAEQSAGGIGKAAGSNSKASSDSIFITFVPPLHSIIHAILH